MLAINNAVATSAGLIAPYVMGSVVQSAGALTCRRVRPRLLHLWARWPWPAA
jgi:hypothetical protein